MTDLRKDKRAPASLKVKYKSGTVDEFVEQFGTDVSRGGIFVKTKKPIEIGALLKLELQLSDASPVIHGVGRVCWRREPGPDANLPAGMGIKFVQLNPESRNVVDRIVQARGGRPSRFDQTDGAEVAPPSTPPPGAPEVAPAAAAPARHAPAAKPGPATVPAARAPAAPPRMAPPPAQAPAAPAAPAPAPRRGSNPGVAGLFADSPMVRGASADPVPQSGRTSFFPPAPDNGAGPSSVPAPPAPARASSPGVVRASAAKSTPRAEQTRQSGEFLATAFAESGVTPPAAARATAKAASGEDELIDQLFAEVMDAPAPPGAAQPASADVDDVFAALSEEEGLSGAPRARSSGAPPASSSGAPSAPSNPPDNVDDLFAELNEAPRAARVAPDAAAGPFAATRAAAGGFDAAGEFEEELQNTSIPPGAWASESDPPRVSSAPPPANALTNFQKPERSSSSLGWILLVLLVAGGVGGYFYYQQARAPEQPIATPLAPEPAPAPAEGAVAVVEDPRPTESEQAPPSGAAARAPAAAPAGSAKPPRAARADEPAPAPAAPAVPGATVQVEISSVPRGADVQVDGKPSGTAPLHLALPKDRESTITVTSAGYATMTQAVTPGDDPEPLRFKLEPLPYEVVVRTDPAEAELSVGPATAIAPGPLALGHLDGGVQVSVGKPGYQRMTRPLRLDEFREENGVMRATIDVRLSPLPGLAPEPERLPRAKRPRAGSSSRAAPPPPAPGTPTPTLSITPAPSAAPAAPAAPASPEPSAP